MSYTPITWTDKSTLIEAEHMNAMEQALKDHDDAIEQLSNSLADNDFFGMGTAIAENTDLNDLTELKKYYCRNSTIGATLSNAPFSGSFSLYVMNLYGQSSSYIQIITRNATSSNILYYRVCQSGTWYSWYLVTGTVVS